MYGIIIACGMLAGLGVACYVAKKSGQNPDTYFDLALVAIICSVIGARIYYVVFRWDLYKDDLLSIFNIRQGGLAIYGGVIAAIITTFVFAKVRKLSFPLLCDTAGLGLILGQAIGRWGNFCNREAFGDYYDGLFAMQLPVSAVRTSDLTEKLMSHTTVWYRKILDRKPAYRPASHPAYQLSGVYGTCRHFGGSISHMDRYCQI